MRRPTLRVTLLVVFVALAGCSYGLGGDAPAAPNAGGGDALGADAATATRENETARVGVEA